ncbi:MAG: SIS domain-containing protein [Bryobacteraceae bacterium]
MFPAQYRDELVRALHAIDAEKVQQAIDWMREARDAGGTIYTAGNGGSAATASHFVCDMVKGASYKRAKRFKMMALVDNMATLTAYANDVHYNEVFAEQLQNFAQPGDIFMAISGSGNSPNVLRAMEVANAAGCKTIALTGRDGGKLGPMAQLEINVGVPHMGRIEDGHHIVCHMICYSFIDNEKQ